jgi:2-dehydro-3-deoxygalactonokinase
VEAPYADVPADVAAVSRSLVHVADAGLWIVPGVAQRHGAPDVMRGEETQLFGAMEHERSLGDAATVVLPGTHSKWARVAGGRIESFTTYMTGELFAVLRAHSILGRLAAPDAGAESASGEDFERGVLAARDAPSGLASVLFSARAAVLVGTLAPAEVLDYLSGLLIGDEIRCGLAAGGRPAALIGDEALCRRYAAALARFGFTDVRLLGDTAPAGLWRVAREAFGSPQRGG